MADALVTANELAMSDGPFYLAETDRFARGTADRRSVTADAKGLSRVGA